MRFLPIAAAAACLAACSSNPPVDPSLTPSAPAIAAERASTATVEEPAAPAADPKSPTRVLGYVEGDVITYRDVLQLVGPELAQIDSAEERTRREDSALLQILRDRLLYRAASDAAVDATRDEIDEERANFVRSLAKNGGTLDAYLHEHEMSRREFDEMIRMQLMVSKYWRAAIGHNTDARVRVRPVTDTFVPPEDVRKYYDRHPAKFKEGEGARYRMLTVRSDLTLDDRVKAVAAAKERADAALARFKAGEDWVPVFRSVADGAADAAHPDGLDDIARGAKAPWIEEFAFGSAKGALSEVIQQGTTFYVLRAEGAHGARTIPFDEAAVGIRRLLSEARVRMARIDVELSVLDESSVRPDALRARLRESLRQARNQYAAGLTE